MAARDASVAQVQQLPLLVEQTIPSDFMDEYGHMNVRWYSSLWGQGASVFMASLKMDHESMMAKGTGHWVLRQVLDFLAEIRTGDSVAIHGRLLGYSEKRLHNKYWMINSTKGVVSSTSEVLVANADLKARRMTPYSPEVAERLREKLAEFSALDWEAPVCGAITP